MPDIVLETRDLSKHFGGLQAVEGVNLRVAEGSLHAIIGPNGAGKTTLLNLICGRFPPTRGQVFFLGREVTGLPPHRLARLGIGRTFQITSLFPTLTVLEHVRLAAQAQGGWRNAHFWRDMRAWEEPWAQAYAVLERVGLLAQAHLPAAALPHGDRRRLELAMALAQQPRLLLLDEPAAGLAAEQIPALMDLIRSLADGRLTIVLVEHNMQVVMNLAQRITVMHQGRILAEGTPAEVAADPQVQSAYLGDLYRDHLPPAEGSHA